MKKILFAIMIFFGTITTVLAKDTTISVTNATGKKGDTVKVQIKLKDNPEFGLIGIKIDYDTNILSYEKGKTKNLDNAMLKSVEEVDGTITMYALTISDLMDDTGVIAEITFKIKENKVKETPLKVRVTDYGVDETKTLPYQVKDGKITIKDYKEENTQTEAPTSEETPSEAKDDHQSTGIEEAPIENQKEPTIEKEPNKVIGSKKENKKQGEKESSSYHPYLSIPLIGVPIVLMGTIAFVRKGKKDVKK